MREPGRETLLEVLLLGLAVFGRHYVIDYIYYLRTSGTQLNINAYSTKLSYVNALTAAVNFSFDKPCITVSPF